VYAGIHITTPQLFQGYEVQPLKLMNIYQKFKFKNIYGFINPLDWHHIDTVESLREAEKFIDNKIN
jgi:NDP-sugar pyrophosphorylase family protein